MKRFKDKVVLVTGAGSGIGRSTALRMDAEGAILIIIDINEDELIKTKSMLKNKESTAKVLDISTIADVKKFFKDKKMSIFAKQNQWVLSSRDDILWIIGERADNRFIKTKGKCLKISI